MQLSMAADSNGKAYVLASRERKQEGSIPSAGSMYTGGLHF